MDQELQRLIEQLPTETERQAVLQAMEEYATVGTSAVEAQLLDAEFERPIVPIAEWLEDPYYVGQITQDLYPRCKEDLIAFFEGNYWMALFSGSLGWGKTTTSMLGFVRILYELSCYRQPARSLGQAANSPIYLANLSVTGKQAKRAAYSALDGMISQIPYFREVCKPEPGITSELRFPKRITVFPGTGSESSILGLNLMGGLLDEVNLMAITTQGISAERSIKQGKVGYDQARTLMNAMVRRAKSRFLSYGRMPVKIFVISSRMYPGEFTDQLEQEAQTDPGIFVRGYALWEVKRQHYSKKTFRVELPTTETRARVLTDESDHTTIVGKIIEVPEDFLPDFQKDPDGSLREFAGIAVGTAKDAFIKLKERLYAAVIRDEQAVGRRQPTTMDPLIRGLGGVTVGGLNVSALAGPTANGYVPLRYPDARRVIHLDSGLRRDAFGLVMGCAPMAVTVTRRRDDGAVVYESAPFIWIDLMARVCPPENSEVDFAALRTLIYQLKDWGFKIARVTMDSWQTVEMRQHLQAKGFQIEEVSVDASEDPYQCLKQTFYEDRISLYRHEHALTELTNLERDAKRRKIDHPMQMIDAVGQTMRGTKDVADGLAGACWTLTKLFSTLQPPAHPSPGQMVEAKPTLGYGVEEYEWLLGVRAGDE